MNCFGLLIFTLFCHYAKGCRTNNSHRTENDEFHHHDDGESMTNITVKDRVGISPTQLDRNHRGLRSTLSVSPMAIGNQTYAGQQEFINNRHRCGAKHASAAMVETSTKITNKWMMSQFHRLNQASSVEIETYFHVITDGSTGVLSDSDLQIQLGVLNDSFRPHGFSFKLLGTTRTENSAWYFARSFSSEESAMMAALRVGGASTMNVYFSYANGLAGYATYPSDYSGFPEVDGVVVFSDTIPGNLPPQGEGKTLVHETGHWLGLVHTFGAGDTSLLSLLRIRNGCNSMGDGVSDTPRQRSATKGCPARRDSCPFRRGLDPIHNYMDYSDDVCMTEFTPGQADRMWAMWNEYRALR